MESDARGRQCEERDKEGSKKRWRKERGGGGSASFHIPPSYVPTVRQCSDGVRPSQSLDVKRVL
jgi:hypothetical protein